MTTGRDRDPAGRPRNARARDALGRPLPRGTAGYAPYEGPAMAPDQALREAQRLLDEGRPFTAHEVLEAVWKQTEGPERELWHGLAQLAVGITHAQRGNDTGAGRLRERAAGHLAPFAGTHPHDVAVDELRAWASRPEGPLPRLRRSGGAGPPSGPLGE